MPKYLICQEVGRAKPILGQRAATANKMLMARNKTRYYFQSISVTLH